MNNDATDEEQIIDESVPDQETRINSTISRVCLCASVGIGLLQKSNDYFLSFWVGVLT